jgi:APA family basic amino acid/polyamine antiporter
VFTYGGGHQTNFIAEEIVDPERTLPWALVLGVLVVVAVYVLANAAYVRVLGAAGLAASAAPAADTLAATLGPAGRTLISAGIAASTFGFLNLVVLVTPRVFQAMAADGTFFPGLAVLHPRFRTPSLAIGLQGVWAVVLTLSGTYGKLLDYVVFADAIFFALCGAAVFVLRARAGGSAPPGFRAPGYPVTPAFFVLVMVLIVIAAIAHNPGNAGIGAGLLAMGVPVYYYWTLRR